MDWWIWLIVAVAVVVVLTASALAVQARRRTGGVIAGGRRPRRGKGSRS
ncbi:hypothetical protein [Streptomyces sp. NBC_01216]|nr:hypothetical protein OG393_02775 [Streptomyces sp. NBC_01216]